jgi:hypothetical protein
MARNARFEVILGTGVKQRVLDGDEASSDKNDYGLFELGPRLK